MSLGGSKVSLEILTLPSIWPQPASSKHGHSARARFARSRGESTNRGRPKARADRRGGGEGCCPGPGRWVLGPWGGGRPGTGRGVRRDALVRWGLGKGDAVGSTPYRGLFFEGPGAVCHYPPSAIIRRYLPMSRTVDHHPTPSTTT